MSPENADNVEHVCFESTPAMNLLRELAKLRPIGVAVIIQLEDEEGSVAVSMMDMSLANTQLGIRMLQLKADDEIRKILGDDE